VLLSEVAPIDALAASREEKDTDESSGDDSDTRRPAIAAATGSKRDLYRKAEATTKTKAASSDEDDDDKEATPSATRRKRGGGFKPRKGEAVRVHAGTDCVCATVMRASRGAAKLELKLTRPLCADAHDVLVVETRPERGQGWRLAAHARLAGGTRCAIEGEDDEGAAGTLEVASAVAPSEAATAVADVKAEKEVGATVEDADHDAKTGEKVAADDDDEPLPLLRDAAFLRDRFECALDAAGWGAGGDVRVKLPALVLGRDGGAHAVWANFAAVCATLGRPADHVAAYLVAEGGMSVARMGENAAAAAATAAAKGGGGSTSIGAPGDGRAALRIAHRGRGLRERLSNLLRSYARVFVSCKQCHSAHTQLTRGGATLRGAKAMVVCEKCAASRFVPTLGKAVG